MKYKICAPYWQEQHLVAYGNLYIDIEADTEIEALEIMRKQFEDDDGSLPFDCNEGDLEVQSMGQYNINWDDLDIETE